eukprot:scaffold1231_cov107-Cylindrotheca_fusiformis.AAC.16
MGYQLKSRSRRRASIPSLESEGIENGGVEMDELPEHQGNGMRIRVSQKTGRCWQQAKSQQPQPALNNGKEGNSIIRRVLLWEMRFLFLFNLL